MTATGTADLYPSPVRFLDGGAGSRACDGDSEALAEFVARHPRLFVLTGAGCSTASGIPDYRDAEGAWKAGTPMMLQDFMSHERHRRRYWARSLTGFMRMSAARPNAAHHSLARLERSGKVELLVTQNVDGLHQAAGHHNVIDLHGRIDVVRCLRCAARLPRAVVQNDLIRRNPGFAGLAGAARPDGDSDVGDVDVSDFAVPDCPACGGILKPDVVFFGESVPRERVRLAMAALSRADAMLVVGSSLMVYSGYRFAREMAGRGRPIAALGLGRTRADDLLTLKVTACCTETLAAVVSE